MADLERFKFQTPKAKAKARTVLTVTDSSDAGSDAEVAETPLSEMPRAAKVPLASPCVRVCCAPMRSIAPSKSKKALEQTRDVRAKRQREQTRVCSHTATHPSLQHLGMSC